MLNFSTSHDKSSLLLNDNPYFPLEWPREESRYLGIPLPSPTPFYAWQVQANISAEWLDRIYPPGFDSYGRPLGTDMGGFELAYEYVLFPARDPENILILFELIGISDGYVDHQVDMNFLAANRTQETVQIVLTRDKQTGILSLAAVELVLKLESKDATYTLGGEFNRRIDLQASEPKMTSYIPREWSVCGHQDDHTRQLLCTLGYWWSDKGELIAIIVGSVIGGISVLAGLCYIVWLLIKADGTSAEYVENLRRDDEAARLIDAGDLLDDTQAYPPEKVQDPRQGDLAIFLDDKCGLGEAGFHTARERTESKPLPQLPSKSESPRAWHMPIHGHFVSSSLEEGSENEDSQFGPFMHNAGDSA